MRSFTSKPVKRIKGTFNPPGDKSISHRAVMISSLASGTSEFTNFLESEDCLNTAAAFKEMGVRIEKVKHSWIVGGVGLQGLKKPSKELYVGNSGTTLRLMLGILAFQNFEATLNGDASIQKRPMKRVTIPLRKMGAAISGKEDANFAPLMVKGNNLTAIDHENHPSSAQVKSAILLAGLRAKGKTIVREAIQSRDHTERMLELVGAPILRTSKEVQVHWADHLNPLHYQIPGDISSAAFALVAAIITPDSELIIQNVGLNPTRIGILEVLKTMGAHIEWRIDPKYQVEPVGEIRVRSSRLKAVTIGKDLIPKLIDELPVLMIACALAEGRSVIKDAHELRVKETDRIKSMVTGLNAIGGRAGEREDGCEIEGVSSFKGGEIDSFGDHRTAMSFIVAGLRSRDSITVNDTECINTSYPQFFRDLESISHF